jgi:hypothetical protein
MKAQFSVFFLISLFVISAVFGAPYPQSTYITDINWNWSSHKRGASGSDNWAVTWADDDKQYLMWGDGWGFGGGGTKTSLGSSVITGAYDGQSWADRARGMDGKSYGIISIAGVLYCWYGPGSGGTSYQWQKLKRSTDHAGSWSDASWSISGSHNLIMPTICNYGKDYAGAKDDFIRRKGSGLIVHKPGEISLARVPKSMIWTQSAYEWVSGIDGSGNPTWSSNISSNVPVFKDVTGGVGWCFSVIYNAGLQRYILTTEHGATYTDSKASLGFFESENPWGPWKTIKYYDNWASGSGISGVEKTFFGNFSNKWTSADGKNFGFIFSGTGSMDSYNCLKGSFVVANLCTTTPDAVTGLAANAVSESQIDLTWNAGSAGSCNISGYRIYENDVLVGTSNSESYSHTGLSEGTSYTYRISALNGTAEGPKSSAVSKQTLADQTKPTVASASATSNTAIQVSFSEQVEKTSAENTGNYSINAGASITYASLGTDNKTVILTVSQLTEGVEYTLGISGVKDRANTPNTMTAVNKSIVYTGVLTVALVQYLGSNTAPTVKENAFETSAPQSNDRTSTWENVPAELTDLTYLLTARDDKNDALAENAVMYRVSLSTDATVYCLVDGTPSWLAADGWTLTNITGPTGNNVVYKVYSKSFSAGTIDLKRYKSGMSQGTSYVFEKAGTQNPVITDYMKLGFRDRSISIYPNPFSGTTRICLMQNENCKMQNAKLRIFDMCGRQVYSSHVTRRTSLEWDASNLPGGTYLIKVRANDQILSKKAIINR